MVSGGLMQLVAYGAQDVYLTGNPKITFFKTKYRRHTNFAIETIGENNNHSELNEEENNFEYIEIDHLSDLNFGTNDKCCVCNKYLLTKDMECFLFNKYSDDKYLHHGCTDEMWNGDIYDEDCLSDDVYDIEKVYDWIDFDADDDADDDDDKEIYLEI